MPPLLPAYRAHPGSNVDSPLESARKCMIWGWCLVGGGCLIALIPFIGIITWFIGPPLIVTGFVLAIVTIAKGRTAGGICLLLFSMFVAPFTVVLGPVVSSLIGVARIDEPAGDDYIESGVSCFPGSGGWSRPPDNGPPHK